MTDSANLTFNGTTLTANTIGAYTLSGTIAGGGNQLNNIIIGTSTPLAGSFTTINASTSITNAGLTSGRVTYAGTSGILQDSANLTFDGATLTTSNGSGAAGLIVNSSANTPYLRFDQSNAAKFTIGESSIVGGGAGFYDFYAVASVGQRFWTGATQRMTITSAGNVGIGTSSPATKLNIENAGECQLQMAYSSTIFGRVGRLSSGNYEFSSYENGGNLLFGTTTTNGSTTERMRIDSGGAVGIGNTNAASFTTFSPKLVVGSGSGGQRITIYSGAGQEGDLIFADGTTGNEQYRGTVRYDHADDAMKFYTNGGTNAMIISSAQNVGIGTAPTTMLHLQRDTTSTSAPVYPNIRIDNPNAAGYTGFYFYQGATQKAGFELGNASGALQFVGTSSEWMRITSGGNVGIGTSSPAQLLQVNGAAGNPATSGSTQNGIVRLSNTTDNGVLDIGIKSGGTGAWLQSTDGGASGLANQYPLLLNPVGGNVGIGTTSPDTTTLLTVAGAVTITGANSGHGASRLKLGQDTSAISQIRFYGVDASTAGILQFTGSSSDGTVGSERMRIDASGNLLVGTISSPSGTGQINAPKGLTGTPAFSVYRGTSNQSITTSTTTKVELNTEEFDTANAFDSTTNYRFTPLIAGYYQISGQIEVDGTAITRSFCLIYKNGSPYKVGNDGVQTTAYKSVVSVLVYLNGSIDYIELYGWANGTSPVFYNSSGTGCYLTGVLVRGE